MTVALFPVNATCDEEFISGDGVFERCAALRGHKGEHGYAHDACEARCPEHHLNCACPPGHDGPHLCMMHTHRVPSPPYVAPELSEAQFAILRAYAEHYGACWRPRLVSSWAKHDGVAPELLELRFTLSVADLFHIPWPFRVNACAPPCPICDGRSD